MGAFKLNPNVKKQLEAAACAAVSAGAIVLQDEVKENLNKHDSGTPANPGQPSKPGSPPGKQSGTLSRSIQVDLSKCKSDLEATVGTNLIYAKIHEFGGTINHPGGTPYIVTKRGAVFISKAAAANMGKKVKLTKAHVIFMPMRPYMGPAIKTGKPKALKAAAGAFKAVIGRG